VRLPVVLPDLLHEDVSHGRPQVHSQATTASTAERPETTTRPDAAVRRAVDECTNAEAARPKISRGAVRGANWSSTGSFEPLMRPLVDL
jgi:hypothetical protein